MPVNRGRVTTVGPRPVANAGNSATLELVPAESLLSPRPRGKARRVAVKGILRIAYKLLVNDRGKFAALLIGITFAVFLIVMMTSMFAGILHRSSATVVNIGAKVWVMDPAVNTPVNSIPMPDYVLDAVRSIDGVRYAVPLYFGGALVKLHSGV